MHMRALGTDHTGRVVRAQGCLAARAKSGLDREATWQARSPLRAARPATWRTCDTTHRCRRGADARRGPHRGHEGLRPRTDSGYLTEHASARRRVRELQMLSRTDDDPARSVDDGDRTLRAQEVHHCLDGHAASAGCGRFGGDVDAEVIHDHQQGPIGRVPLRVMTNERGGRRIWIQAWTCAVRTVAAAERGGREGARERNSTARLIPIPPKGLARSANARSEPSTLWIAEPQTRRPIVSSRWTKSEVRCEFRRFQIVARGS